MKIAFLNKYQEKVNRGAETYVVELSKRLSNKHKVDVISSINYLTLFKKNYDLVIPTNGRLQVFLIRLITLLRGKKMIVSGQSGIGLDDRLNLYAFPDYFVALTNYAASWAKKINPFVKVVTIPNGVDLNEFKPTKNKKEGKIKTVLAVGAFTKEKRHDLTIKAVARLKNVKLIIAGSGGNMEDEINKLGDKLLKDRIEIISVKHNKMPQIYQKADVFVYPTVPCESFGIAMVEAMASGLPVVVNNDPIRKEIVGDAGILVDPEDTDTYGKAIQESIEIDWKDIPRIQAEKFSWENIARKYEDVLTKIK